MYLILTDTHQEAELMRALGALKSLEEVTISFTPSKYQDVSLLPLRGLPKLKLLSLSSDLSVMGGHCVRVRGIKKVLHKCCQLTELHMKDVEVVSGEDVSSPVLGKLVLEGCLCSSSWLERLNCPSLERVELTSVSPTLRGDEESLPNPGMPAIERAVLAQPGPVHSAATGLGRLPAACGVIWCSTPQDPLCGEFNFYGSDTHSLVTTNLGAQAACLASLRGSAAAHALRQISFAGVVMAPGAVANVASIFPNEHKVSLVSNYFPPVLWSGSVAAIVKGWSLLCVLELMSGETGWRKQDEVQQIVAQAKAAVQVFQHCALTVTHVEYQEMRHQFFIPAGSSDAMQMSGKLESEQPEQAQKQPMRQLLKQRQKQELKQKQEQQQQERLQEQQQRKEQQKQKQEQQEQEQQEVGWS